MFPKAKMQSIILYMHTHLYTYTYLYILLKLLKEHTPTFMPECIIYIYIAIAKGLGACMRVTTYKGQEGTCTVIANAARMGVFYRQPRTFLTTLIIRTPNIILRVTWHSMSLSAVTFLVTLSMNKSTKTFMPIEGRFTLWTMKLDHLFVRQLIGCSSCPGTTLVYTKKRMAEEP
jgi:hypothetical protein